MLAARRRPAASGLAVCLALVVAACGAGSSSPTTSPGPAHPGGGGRASAPAADTFSGSIVSGTGRYSNHRGRVMVYLHPRGAGVRRTVEVVLRGGCGAQQAACLDLNGVLTGTLTRSGHQIPDTGQGYTLSGSGSVQPLGQARASGGVEGTGFISRGQELMRLTLTTPSGSITLSAHSGPVKGFSSP